MVSSMSEVMDVFLPPSVCAAPPSPRHQSRCSSASTGRACARIPVSHRGASSPCRSPSRPRPTSSGLPHLHTHTHSCWSAAVTHTVADHVMHFSPSELSSPSSVDSDRGSSPSLSPSNEDRSLVCTELTVMSLRPSRSESSSEYSNNTHTNETRARTYS